MKLCKCSNECKKKVTDSNGLACDACNSWQTYSCLGVPEYLFNAMDRFIKEGGDSAHIFISCKKCMVSVMPVAAIKKGVSSESKVLSDKIDALNVSVNESITDQIAKIEQKLDEEIKSQVTILKDQIESNGSKLDSFSDVSKTRWADIVNRSNKAEASINKVEVAINKSAQEHVNLEEREKSIIIYNKEESTKDSNIDRNKEDFDYVNDLITKGMYLPSQPIQSCYRLGRYNKDINRPMRVTFCTKTSHVLVLNSLTNLKEADASYKKVSITVDRSKSERALFKAKVEEAKQLSNNTGKTYRVRGTYSPVMYEKL